MRASRAQHYGRRGVPLGVCGIGFSTFLVPGNGGLALLVVFSLSAH